jgi:hypothetical protein
MSLLAIWTEDNPSAPLQRIADPAWISTALREIGCRFERRPARMYMAADASADTVLDAYRDVTARFASFGWMRGTVSVYR